MGGLEIGSGGNDMLDHDISCLTSEPDSERGKVCVTSGWGCSFRVILAARGIRDWLC